MALKSNFSGNILEAGCDEAGRGCLAGPVVAAAVILPFGYENDLIDDSKKLSEKKRKLLKEIIIADALDFGIGVVDSIEIDKINILNASILAMHIALSQLKTTPDFIIVDGNRFKNWNNIPHNSIIKGDSQFLSIAAASILAKTTRDDLMEHLHAEFPQYNWQKNKGYPTLEHIKGIDAIGYSKYHRQSFHLKRQLKLDF
jgi:ribonuclease HII